MACCSRRVTSEGRSFSDGPDPLVNDTTERFLRTQELLRPPDSLGASRTARSGFAWNEPSSFASQPCYLRLVVILDSAIMGAGLGPIVQGGPEAWRPA
jgi:hypothetical protein